MPTVAVTANGPTTIAAPLATASTALMIAGDPQGGTIVIEASSNAGANFAPVTGFTPQEPGVYNMPLPAGWHVRAVVTGAKAAPTLVVGLD